MKLKIETLAFLLTAAFLTPNPGWASLEDGTEFVFATNEEGADDLYYLACPRYAGHLIAKHSNLDDVCKLLGYSKSLNGSDVYASFTAGAKTSEPYAAVIQGTKVSGSGNDQYLEKLICVGRVRQDFPDDQVLIVKDPNTGASANAYDNKKIYFSWYNDPKAVCFKLGYANTVAAAILKTQVVDREPLLIVDDFGKVIEASSTHYYRITELKCVSSKKN